MMKTEHRRYQKSTCSVGLYLRGDFLDPVSVTSTLGCYPSRSWLRGDRKTTSSGQSIVRKSGLWSLVEHSSGSDYQRLTENILSKISGVGNLFSTLDNLEEAEIAFFVACDAIEASEVNFEYQLASDTIQRVAKLGVTLSFAISFIGSVGSSELNMKGLSG